MHLVNAEMTEETKALILVLPGVAHMYLQLLPLPLLLSLPTAATGLKYGYQLERQTHFIYEILGQR